ncbi:MAG TPA: glycosyltransferase family 87 protein [Candidatus Limnocylindrales bacterium]|jgi:hypothetical protein
MSAPATPVTPATGTPPSTGHARRAGVIRRALRRETVRIREPRRAVAMGLLIIAFALAIAGMTARGERAGADAQAYWAAVRMWLEGGNPYHPTGPFLPYVYAPWMLPLFAPWALLPWEVAWFAWRGATILLLLWSIRWAYARRPLPTAILVGLLAFPMAANLDTGNINVLLALMVFGAHFTGPRPGAAMWAIASWMKWIPAPLWLVLPAKARGWGLVFLVISMLLSLAMLPLTIIQLQALFGFGERPFRADYLVFIWSAVPWWWRLHDPFAFLRLRAWRDATGRLAARAGAWTTAFRASPGPRLRATAHAGRDAATRFVGLDPEP